MSEHHTDPDQLPLPDDPETAAPDADESERWDEIVPDELLPLSDDEGDE